MYGRRGSRVGKVIDGLMYGEVTNVEAFHTKLSFTRNPIRVTTDILLIIIMHITSMKDKSNKRLIY